MQLANHPEFTFDFDMLWKNSVLATAARNE